MEVSAKNLFCINELFFLAQTHVLYPVRPILDLSSNSFKDDCTRALIRIFRMFDKDGDGLLSDKELNDFQEFCFGEGMKLEAEDLDNLKKLVTKMMSSSTGSINNSTRVSAPLCCMPVHVVISQLCVRSAPSALMCVI